MDKQHRVDATLFHHLIGNSAIPLIGSAAGSALVSFMQWELGNRRLAIGWLCFVYAAIFLRIVILHRCRAGVADHGYRPTTAMRYALTTGISGIAWGLGGMMVEGTGTIGLTITITAIQAMVIGGIGTLGAYLPAFLAFAIPAVLPMVFALAYIGGTANLVLAVYNFIFLLLLILIAVRFNRTLRRTWQLTFDKEDLLNALTVAHDRVAVLADTDALTGLANRRRFDTVMESEFSRLRRSGAPLSLILLDVDHFKLFNDTYGHVAGDECLKQVAAAFQRFFQRAPDFAGRYGGEEFFGILPETDHEGAVALAERVRAEVAALAIPHRTSVTADHVTASLGVVTLDCATMQGPSDAVTIADQQLYRAKSEGRNRIAAWNGRHLATPK